MIFDFISEMFDVINEINLGTHELIMNMVPYLNAMFSRQQEDTQKVMNLMRRYNDMIAFIMRFIRDRETEKREFNSRLIRS
jgi:uncharacterized pyridoxamine 5'-phosphate oxidase family protein